MFNPIHNTFINYLIEYIKIITKAQLKKYK